MLLQYLTCTYGCVVSTLQLHLLHQWILAMHLTTSVSTNGTTSQIESCKCSDAKCMLKCTIHSSQRPYIHLEYRTFISKTVHSSRIPYIHLEYRTFISNTVHSSRIPYIHLKTVHSSQRPYIHLEERTFISKTVHLSRIPYIHLEDRTFISKQG